MDSNESLKDLAPRVEPLAHTEFDQLEARMWRNWQLLIALILVTTLGFAMEFIPSAKSAAWFQMTTFARLALVIGAMVMVLWVTRQQRKAMEMRQKLRGSLDSATKKVQSHYERVRSMLDVTRTLAKEVNPQAIFDRICETCLNTFDCDQASVMILNTDTGDLEVRSARGHVDPEKVIGQTLKVGQGIAGWVAENRKPLRLGDSLQIKNRFGIRRTHEAALSAAMVVPILVRDELVGVLNVSSRKEGCLYDEEDLNAMNVFAEHVGVTCRHSEQALWMRETITLLENELYALKAKKAA